MILGELVRVEESCFYPLYGKIVGYSIRHIELEYETKSEGVRNVAGTTKGIGHYTIGKNTFEWKK